MPRFPRLKVEGLSATYHVTARTSAQRGEYPLANPVMAEKLVELIEFYTAVYFCSVHAYIVMGNHYHLIVQFEKPRDVEHCELERRARKLYSGSSIRTPIDLWSPGDWKRFEERLFNVSELMRNIQGRFARWYNTVVDRRGHVWAERFSSTIVGEEALLDCMLYVELNAVRAGLVDRPEDWRFSSLHRREVGNASWLSPLSAILPLANEDQALTEFRTLIYHRGAVPTRSKHAVISHEQLAREAERGFAARGVFARRLRHFSEGLVIGARTRILELIAERRQRGLFRCRQDPVAKLDGVHWALKDQYRLRSPT